MWGGALALLALAGVAGEFRSPLNGDAAYMLDAARRMLAGERLYADLIDLNPPFVFWLSELAVIISRIGVDPADVLRVIVLAILGVSLALAWPLTRDAPAIRAGFILFAFALPLGHFGEREHLIFGLMVPYVALIAAGWGTGNGDRGPLLAGIAAGVAVAIKPPAALVPIVLTLYACIRERSLRPVASTENLAATGTLGVALVTVVLFAPAYLGAVSDYGALYAEFSRGTLRQLLFRDIYPLSVWIALGICALTIHSVGNSRRASVLMLASAGFLAAAVAQGKGFGYHYFPAMGFAVMTLLELLAAPVMDDRHTAGVARRVVAGTSLLLVLLLPFVVAAERFMGKAGSDVLERRGLSGALQDLGPGSRVAIFSVRLADAYPILLERRWEHVLSMPHLWFTDLSEGAASAALWRRVGENLRDGAPGAIIVRAPLPAERTRGDLAVEYLPFVCRDPVARAALAGYARTGHAAGYDIYRPAPGGTGACRA